MKEKHEEGDIYVNKKLKMIVAIGTCIGLLAGCGNTQGIKGNTGKDAIKINDTVLKSDYVDKRINQLLKINNLTEENSLSDYYKASIISGLVNSQLLSQEADKRKISASKEEINDLYDKSVASYGSKENFQKMMDQFGINEDDFKEMVREQVIYTKMSDELTKDMTIDAQAYYDAHQDEYKVGDQVKASHILVDSEEEAKAIIADLRNGGDFAKLASEKSKDTSNKDKGGDLGFFSAEEMVKEFSDAAFAMQPGTISEQPVKTTYGYHIIKLDEKKAAHTKTIDEVRDDITKKIKDEKVELKMQELLGQLREGSKIEYLEDKYNPEKLMAKAQEQMQAQANSMQAQGTTEGSNAAANATAEAVK